MRAKPRHRPQTASIEHLSQRLGEVRKKAALSAISSPQLVTKRDEQEAGAEALALARDLQLQASRVNRGREREVRGDLAKLCRVYNDEKRRADEKEKAVALLASELRIGETALQRMLAARADASLQPLVRAEHLEGGGGRARRCSGARRFSRGRRCGGGRRSRATPSRRTSRPRRGRTTCSSRACAPPACTPGRRPSARRRPT